MSNDLSDTIRELKGLSEDTPIKSLPPSDALINEYEEAMDMKFTDDFKYFLKEASNVVFGFVEPLQVTENRDSRSELLNALREARIVGLPEDWLPISEDNGDYYCILPDRSVKFWSHNGVTDESWPDLATWIKNVWIDEAKDE